MPKIVKITDIEKAQCLGKVKHKTLLGAETSLSEMYKDQSTKNWHLLDIYICPSCGNYHIGHEIGSKKPLKNK